jgi:hypothetical protein
VLKRKAALNIFKVLRSGLDMEHEHHMVEGLDIESDARMIAFIRIFISNKDASSTKVIHRGIKEAIKHLIEEGYDVIRRTSDGYKDDSPGMDVIVENMASRTNAPSRVSIRSGNMDKFPNFDRIHDALIQHMTIKGFKRQ